jgi:four helix bundle protein
LIFTGYWILDTGKRRFKYFMGLTMSYKKLEIWQLSKEITIDIHKMSLQLPKFELYEEGSQIRRSLKSVRSNIAEGYGRRKYKNDFIRFLVYALASNDETIDHLETLFETESLRDKELFNSIHNRLEILGRKINKFLGSVMINHNTENKS